MNRIFRSTLPQLSAKAKSSPNIDECVKCATTFLTNMNAHRAFLASSIALGVSLPAAIFLAPSFLSIPFDLVVSVALPVHMYMGTRDVLSDYLPKKIRPQGLQAWALVSAVAGIGLVKIGICGPGIGATIKNLWTPAKVQKKMVRQPRRVE